MRKTILGVIIISILLLPLVALAGETDVEANKSKFYRVGPYDEGDTASFKPTWNAVTKTWTWNGWNDGTPPPNLTSVGIGSSLVMGMENRYNIFKQKWVTVHIEYVGAGHPSLKWANFGNRPKVSESSGNLMPGSIKDIAPDPIHGKPGVYEFVYHIIHQPDWEWFLIEVNATKAADPQAITLTKATIHSVCKKIPSLTPYGVMLLILLLAGTAVWVMRRRRAVASI